MIVYCESDLLSWMHQSSCISVFAANHVTTTPWQPLFFQGLDIADSGKFKVILRSHHVSPILELCKVEFHM